MSNVDTNHQYVSIPDQESVNAKLSELRKNVNTKLEKWSSRIQVSMAFTPKTERVEGEQWSESGKTWVIKDGIKQSVSVTQMARMPNWCPRCERAMSHRFDRKFYYLRGWCYNCNIDIEHEMRTNGTWDAFEREHVRANEVAMLKDKIQEHLDYIKDFKEPAVYFENGGYEVLAKKNQFQPLFDKLLEDVEFCLNRLEEIQQEESNEQSVNL